MGKQSVRWKYERKKVTIREVAALAGVSISSVSRYLTDPKSIKPLAAYNIKNAIRELLKTTRILPQYQESVDLAKRVYGNLDHYRDDFIPYRDLWEI